MLCCVALRRPQDAEVDDEDDETVVKRKSRKRAWEEDDKEGAWSEGLELPL